MNKLEELDALVKGLEAVCACEPDAEQRPDGGWEGRIIKCSSCEARDLLRAQAEEIARKDAALRDLLMRLDNKIALARDSNATSHGYSYVLCEGIEACIEASKARAALTVPPDA